METRGQCGCSPPFSGTGFHQGRHFDWLLETLQRSQEAPLCGRSSHEVFAWEDLQEFGYVRPQATMVYNSAKGTSPILLFELGMDFQWFDDLAVRYQFGTWYAMYFFARREAPPTVTNNKDNNHRSQYRATVAQFKSMSETNIDSRLHDFVGEMLDEMWERCRYLFV